MTANEALNKYLNTLDAKEKLAKKRDIRSVCRISRFVLGNWCQGRTQIPWSLLDKITEAVGENIFAEFSK